MLEALSNPILKDLVYLLAATALLDTISGAYAAYRGGTFDLKFFDAFIPEHVLKRAFPILMTATASVLLSGDIAAALLVAAGAQVVAYEVATVKSITDNLSAASAGTGNVPDSI